MPVYEYQCDSCGEIFEKIQKFADEPLTVHEGGCGGPLRRLLSAPALQFKGTGWYVTDYAKGKSGSSPSTTSKDSAKGESSPKSDSASKSSDSSSSTPSSNSSSPSGTNK